MPFYGDPTCEETIKYACWYKPLSAAPGSEIDASSDIDSYHAASYLETVFLKAFEVSVT